MIKLTIIKGIRNDVEISEAKDYTLYINPEN